MNLLKKVSALKKELDELRPLKKEDERRIMQKFRLDWNFHSNNLEGNSLTYGETKALLLFNITAQGKPLRDHIEITGHDEALKWIEEVVKEKRPLTESFIRQLHTLILKEPYEVDAQTPDGKPIKKLVKLGEYKTTPNHVLTKTGEMFYFAKPEETAAEMTDLMNWYREQRQIVSINPILLATKFHYRFIRIHPFDDGNGRTARILMNFILMSYGYPPVIIKTDDKKNYIAVLQQADAGISEPFVDYVAQNIIYSIELMIKGAKGESVEEPDDLEKEITLMKTSIKDIGNNISLTKEEGLISLFQKSLYRLIEAFINKNTLLDDLYSETEFRMRIGQTQFFNSFNDFKLEFKEKPIEVVSLNTEKLIISYYFAHFTKEGFKDFHFSSSLKVKFDKFYYSVLVNEEHKLEKPYSKQLTEEEINEIVNSEVRRHKNAIEAKLKEL